MHAIETQGLTKSYKTHFGRAKEPALDNLDLVVHEGEVFGFLGRNGAGKTTTIKILCSLLRQTSGEAYIFGEPSQRRSARKHIGYLPENPYFYEYLTPRETLDFYGRLHGLSPSARQAEWDKLRELLELEELADRRVRGFSKGQRQRLGFAVALVGDPQLLILDEPMSGLDPLGRRNIRELILKLRDAGKTLFFSSHVLGDVEQICDKVAILVQGKLRIQGRIAELLSRKVNRVELIATGFEDGKAKALAGRAHHYRASEIGHHFQVDDLEMANSFAKEVIEAGGILLEFNPIKESLEDYFLREQESNDHDARAGRKTTMMREQEDPS